MESSSGLPSADEHKDESQKSKKRRANKETNRGIISENLQRNQGLCSLTLLSGFRIRWVGLGWIDLVNKKCILFLFTENARGGSAGVQKD